MLHRVRSIRPWFVILLTSILLSTLAGCGPAPAAETAPAAPRSVPVEVKPGEVGRLTQAQTRFAFRLFQQLQAKEPDRNLFLSPTSIALLLTLTQNGARGETREQMLAALSLDGWAPEAVNQESAALQRLIGAPGREVQLTMANAIWHKQGLQVNPAFRKTAEEQFGATIRPANFASAASLREVNDWVSRATNGKIPTILEKTEPMRRMVLVNALYFQGDWLSPFVAGSTRPAPFRLPGGTTKNVSMMVQGGSFPYFQDHRLQLIALLYREPGISMYIALPAPGVPFADFCRSITAEQWASWVSSLEDRIGVLYLPRTRFGYSADLGAALKALGMARAFDPRQADFGDLFLENREPLYIERVLHRTTLDIDEKGTAAGAATMADVQAGSAPPKDPFAMTVDRPFLVVIADDRTGAMLFLGAVTDPQP